jgi:large subunit ribosomal protein L25
MELNAEKREILGKKIKQYRYEQKIPAVMFGKGIDSLPLLLNTNEFIKVFKEAGETSVLNLKFNDSNESVLVKDVQFHPVTSEILHVGFYKVDLTQKITADIPVVAVGEEENELVKNGNALVLVLHSSLEVEALPMDLPHEFEVNVAALSEVGDHITIEELSYDREKVEILNLEVDEPVVKLDYAEIQETEEEISEAEALAAQEVEEGGEVVEGAEGEEAAAKAGDKPAEEASEEKSEEE